MWMKWLHLMIFHSLKGIHARNSRKTILIMLQGTQYMNASHVSIFPWPAKLPVPDLNPIEKLWKQNSWRLSLTGTKSPNRNLDELWEASGDHWARFSILESSETDSFHEKKTPSWHWWLGIILTSNTLFMVQRVSQRQINVRIKQMTILCLEKIKGHPSETYWTRSIKATLQIQMKHDLEERERGHLTPS